MAVLSTASSIVETWIKTFDVLSYNHIIGQWFSFYRLHILCRSVCQVARNATHRSSTYSPQCHCGVEKVIRKEFQIYFLLFKFLCSSRTFHGPKDVKLVAFPEKKLLSVLLLCVKRNRSRDRFSVRKILVR